MSKDCQCTSCHSCIAYIAKTVIIVVGRWTFCDTWRVQNGIPQFGNFSFFESISGFGVCPSSLRRWSLFLLVGFTDPYNHTYSESLWWKLFKNNKRTQIQRQRQWQRQRQRQRHRESAWKTQHMLHFWNPDDLLIPNMMIDTSPWSSCSCLSPWLGCSGHTFSCTGLSVSPFRDFFKKSAFIIFLYNAMTYAKKVCF